MRAHWMQEFFWPAIRLRITGRMAGPHAVSWGNPLQGESVSGTGTPILDTPHGREAGLTASYLIDDEYSGANFSVGAVPTITISYLKAIARRGSKAATILQYGS